MNEDYIQLPLPGFEDVEVIDIPMVGNEYYFWKKRQDRIKEYHGLVQLQFPEMINKEKE